MSAQPADVEQTPSWQEELTSQLDHLMANTLADECPHGDGCETCPGEIRTVFLAWAVHHGPYTEQHWRRGCVCCEREQRATGGRTLPVYRR